MGKWGNVSLVLATLVVILAILPGCANNATVGADMHQEIVAEQCHVR